MSAVNKIMDELGVAFAQQDAKVLENSIAWGKSQAARLREFEASDEAKALRHDAWKFYPKAHAIAGGKSWYAVFHLSSGARIEEFIVKNCASVAASRNARIAKKLVNAGISEVSSSEVIWSSDGFNGQFRVESDKGQKSVRVQSIYAGGYNIQCLHLRVLVNVG